MRNKNISIIATIFFVVALIISCSKEDPAPTDPCAGKTIVVNAAVTPTSGGSSNNGSIAATATGSTGFTYSLNNGSFQASGTFNNLSAATYTITAKDDEGCSVSKTFTVDASACPTITITATVANTSAPSTTDGSITATATGSTGITYSLNGGAFQATGTFNGLAANSYLVTAKDVNGCTSSQTFVVSSAACPTITVATTITTASGPSATNGAIIATATGGVAPYTYSINGGAFQATGTFNNLAVGNYTIAAKDANGCLGSSGSVAVTSAACPTITVSANTTGADKCAGNTGAITVTASGSTGLMYNINNGTYQSSNIFNSLTTGNYTVGVKDANGCTNTASATVNQAAAGALFGSVKAVLAANCALSGCHAGPTPQNGINFTDDCTIVSQAARIKARAVDANPSVMPPTGSISAGDKQKIVDWVNAGGKYTN